MSKSMYAMDEQERNPRIKSMLLGSGWAAVMVVSVHDARTGEYLYMDVQETGMGRYATREEAEAEARAWAEADGVPFVG